MTYQDRTLTCQDCGQAFTFTAGEQEFYAGKGYTNDPKRCPTCREARRGDRSGGARQLYPAVCARCGKATQVPFQPRGDRPVYCSDCYSRQAPPRGARRF